MDGVFLSDEFRRAWGHTDPFDQVSRLQGLVFRQVRGRRTLRFELNGKSYFVKIHEGVGWAEIIKNLLNLKRPVVGAENEWKALLRLREIGLDVPTPLAYGSRGGSPATRKSFIITEDLADTVNLEQFCADWPHHPPAHRLKVALIERVAAITRQMHSIGMNHRDCYLCHFLLDAASVRDPRGLGPIRLHLIDLHRAQIRRSTPWRWIVKDVAGLTFSSMDIGMTRTDRLRFIRAYHQEDPRRALRDNAAFWKSVSTVGRRLYRKHFGRWPVPLF